MACVDQGDDVVLTGLSGRLPEAGCVDEFARQLFAGVDLVTVDDRRWTPGWYGLPERHGKLPNLTHFDAAFFGVHAKQAHVMDPQIRLLLEVAHETLVDAGYNPTEMRGSRTGVYVGVSISETKQLLEADIDNIAGYVATGCNFSAFANRISYAFDFKGPSLAIDSACASSMFALAQAADDIRNNRCTAAVVAGTHICIKPQTSLLFQRLGMLSPEGRCASFDASASGYARSEAVVAVLLQRRCDARRMYCTVRGAGTNNDGWKVKGITYPAGAMQRHLAEETFEQARLRPQDVAYVEAHGTGTKAGDLEEVNAIAELFCKDRQTPLLLGSVKSNMGHAEPAAGLCAIAKVVVAMECGVIPGNLHFKSPNKGIPALSDGRIQVVDKNTAWQGGLVAINSAGFGGSNAHVILEGGRGVRPPPSSGSAPRLVLASGRTDEAVERILKLAAEHPRDAELHALLDAVHARPIPRHPRRGYAVLDSDHNAPPVFNVIACEPEPRPVWLMFSGFGVHPPGIARTLLRLPVFAASIARSAAALKPYGVDLHYVITDAPEPASIDAIIECFVLITAVQVALVDVLRELSVHPDGIIGLSCGEIGCAYADGVLTAEQAMLCSYWRGRCVLEAQVPPGAVAFVALSWDETRRYCSTDIECACYKTAENIVIVGPPASVEKAVEKLAAEGVHTKLIPTLGVAFHSKYSAAAAPQMHEKLLKVIPEPKQRSARWLSSAVPKDQWDSDLARLSDATYFVNNFLNPVRFADVLEQVPEQALVLEMAPFSVNQMTLKNELPRATHVPLLPRGAPNALAHLMAAVGKVYAAGAQPQVARLYPAVTWPVSRGTPGLASHVGWDHSVEWSVADFRTAGRVGENIVQYDLGKPDNSFLAGHIIDGRTIFPAAGYLTLAWRTITKMKNLKMEDTAVVLENVQFHRATFVSRDVPLQFHVSLLSGSSMFEICESGEVVATGTARLAIDPTTERLPTAALDDTKEMQENLPHLNSDDIYKVLRLRGFNFKDVFCGIKSSNARATRGLVDWAGNWITFIDSMIQFICLSEDKPGLYLPTRLQRAVIDPVAQRAAVSEGSVLIKSSLSIDVTVAGGVEIRGMKWSAVSRREAITGKTQKNLR